MRNKFGSLIMGLMVILLAPVLTSSCAHDTGKSPAVSTIDGYGVVDLQPADMVCTAGVYVLSALVETTDPGLTTEPSDLQPAEKDILDQVVDDDGVFGWRNILILVLGIISVLFATLWKRARNVIAAIAEALKDGKVDKTELNNILKAWKEG
jgi:hypothetical protein